MSVDKRIVYGATCTFWDSITNLPRPAKGDIPRCPHCGGPLYEVASMGVWEYDIARYAREKHDPDYVAFMKWAQGKPCCVYSTSRAAHNATSLRAAYNATLPKDAPKPEHDRTNDGN